MIRRKTRRHGRQERLAIRSRAEREFLEIPRFSRRERQPFGVDDNLQGSASHTKCTAESAA